MKITYIKGSRKGEVVEIDRNDAYKLIRDGLAKIYSEDRMMKRYRRK